MENSIKKRNPIYDCAKGLGILFVVMGHCYAFGYQFYTKFHVLFFFVFSGLMLKSDNINDLKCLGQNLCKLWKRYALPYIICNSIFLMFYNVFVKYHLITNDYRYSVGVHLISLDIFFRKLVKILFLLSPSEQLCGATWFLKSLFGGLFFITILLFTTSKYNKKIVYIITSIVFIISSIIIDNKFLFLFSQCILCLIIGDCLKKYITKFASNTHIYVLGFAIMILLIGIYFVKIKILSIILCSIFGFIFMIQCSMFLKEYLNRIYVFFVYIGQRTMPILCLHLLFFKLITYIYILITNSDINSLGIFPSIQSINHPIFLNCLYIIVGILFPILCNLIYKKTKSLICSLQQGDV